MPGTIGMKTLEIRKAMTKSVWEWTVFNLMTDTAVLAEQQPEESNDE
jgi:hypothetical protein